MDCSDRPMQFSLQGFVHCLLRGHMNLNLNNGEFCPSLYKLPDRLTGFFCSCTLLLRLYSVNCIVLNTEKRDEQTKQRNRKKNRENWLNSAWSTLLGEIYCTTVPPLNIKIVTWLFTIALLCIVIHPVTNIVYKCSLQMYHLSVSVVSLNCVTVLCFKIYFGNDNFIVKNIYSKEKG